MRIKLFPFDKIPKNSHIIIYGMGPIGEGFIKQINILSYCSIAGCIDANFKNKKLPSESEAVFLPEAKTVMPPEAIKNMSYDYVVVASVQYKQEIEKTLLDELFVPKEKIVVLDDHYYVESYITTERDWSHYYINAEKSALREFEITIKPIFEKYSLFNNQMKTMDFACGRGRIANLLKNEFEKLILCDISSDALEFCKDRFKHHLNIEYIQSLPEKLLVDDESLDIIYSWDAMVHFNYKMLDIYISEFSRILKNGGYCFIHHSDLAGCLAYDSARKDTVISENFNENPKWRANVAKQDVEKIAKRNGFEVLEQRNIDWGIKGLDCITVLKK